MLDASDAADVIDLVRDEHGAAANRPAVPEEGDAARRVLAHGQHAAAAVGGDRRGGAVVRRPARADRVDLPRVRRTASACSVSSTSTICSSTGARPRPTIGSARCSRPRSTTSASTSTRTSTRCRSTCSARCAAPIRGSPSSATTRRRCTASAARAPATCSTSTPRSPAISTILLERNYRSVQPILDVANAVSDGRARGVHGPAARGVAGRRAAPARALRRRGRAGRRGVRAGPGPPRGGHRAARAGGARPRRAPQRPARARAVAAPHPVREVRRAALPRGRAREGSRSACSAWPTTRATSSRGSGCSSSSKASVRCAPAGRSTRSASTSRAPTRRCCCGGRSRSRSFPPASRRTADAFIDALARATGRVGRCARRATARRARPARRARLRQRRRAPRRSRHARGRGRTARPACPTSPPTSPSNRRTPPATSPATPLIDEDWLVISTVHSAKGLEWDVVHLLNAADGNFPSDMALTSNEGLEEERRLFYVAVTRPRRHLHVYVPLRFHYRPRGRDDDHTMSQPSRFLSAAVTRLLRHGEHAHGTTPSPASRSTRGSASRWSSTPSGREPSRAACSSDDLSAGPV